MGMNLKLSIRPVFESLREGLAHPQITRIFRAVLEITRWQAAMSLQAVLFLLTTVHIKKTSSQKRSIVRMIDFAPNVKSPLHGATSLDYGIILEGEFKLILDSGEERAMRQRDISIQRSNAHLWHNITANCTAPGRMIRILLDCQAPCVIAEDLQEYHGELAPFYTRRG